MNIKSTAPCIGDQLEDSEATATIVRFGELAITFRDSGQLKPITSSPAGSFYMDIRVSCQTAVEQIREQLIEAGYQTEGNQVEHKDYTEFYFLLRKKARCLFCGHLNIKFGIMNSLSLCGRCGKHTSGNTVSVYVCGNGTQIDENLVRKSPTELPQPIGIKIVQVK